MKRLLILFSLLLVTGISAAAYAQTRNTEVIRAENYLKNLKTGKARFVQTTSDGREASGTFYLKRPGKLRFQYEKPSNDFVVADGLFIYFYDSEMEQQSNAPIGQTLADFILRKDLKLSGDVTVQKVARANGLIQILLTQTDDAGAGTLTLGFTEQPYQLKKWRVVDGAGGITEVELFDLKTGMDLPNSLFVYRDPKPTGYNQ